MAPIAFRSLPLPSHAAATLRAALVRAHRQEPFRAVDPRHAAKRAAGVAEELGLEVTLYRGALDLDGSEVDHLWVDLSGRVIDVAFPLFVADFVQVLRDYVVGHAGAAELEEASAGAGLDDRVLGEFPRPLRYRGEPVWSVRHARAGDLRNCRAGRDRRALPLVED